MSIPLVQLHCLGLLRGFVAIGRRMSITLAAQDLCITQSAASRQVQALEEMLGTKLLVRGHRSISFTPDGERLFRSADSAIQQLQDAVGAIKGRHASQPVTVTCSIGFAGLWLMPRLGEFLRGHPGIDVRVSANNRVSDLARENLDLAIRYCAREAAPEGAVRLFGEAMAPVAHPSLGLAEIDGPEVLARQVLLEYDGPGHPWLQWADFLESQRWGGVKTKAVLRFNQYDHVIHAAISGQGIALGRLNLIGPMLEDGRLAVLATPTVTPLAPYAYWLIQREPAPRAEVLEVVRWIRQEAAEPAGQAASAPPAPPGIPDEKKAREVSGLERVVERKGIEPSTSALRTRRSPS